MCIAENIVPLFVSLISEFWWRLTEATLLVKLSQQSLVGIMSEVHSEHCRIRVILGQIARKEQTEAPIWTTAVYLVRVQVGA
jgi:hypothetical protein